MYFNFAKTNQIIKLRHQYNFQDESFDNNFLRVTHAVGKPTVVSEVLPVSIRTNTQPDEKCITEKSAGIITSITFFVIVCRPR